MNNTTTTTTTPACAICAGDGWLETPNRFRQEPGLRCPICWNIPAPTQLTLGLERQRRGHAQIARGSSAGWVSAALAGISRFAAVRPAGFTADDLRPYLEDTIGEPPSPNAMGMVFKVAEERGAIVADGFVRSTRPEARGRRIVRWRSA